MLDPREATDASECMDCMDCTSVCGFPLCTAAWNSNNFSRVNPEAVAPEAAVSLVSVFVPSSCLWAPVNAATAS
jgi:hypothetical protein